MPVLADWPAIEGERKRDFCSRESRCNDQTFRLIISDWSSPCHHNRTAGAALRAGELVDCQARPFHSLPLSLNGRISPFLGVHGGESETTGASGHFIHDDADLVHGTVLGKHVPEVSFSDVEGKISHV
jgi:hypothetical protein